MTPTGLEDWSANMARGRTPTTKESQRRALLQSVSVPNLVGRFFNKMISRQAVQELQIGGTSAPLSKFVIHRSTSRHELRKQRGTSKFMILVPLFDLKFLDEFAAGGAGTSNRRH